MPVDAFLQQVQTLLQQGNATEHSYRPALQRLFNTLLAPATATNEPKHAQYGAPDFVIQQGTTPVGHVEAKDVGVDLQATIADSERATPKTSNGKQLKRYRAALPNLLYTDGLEWHWFVNGEPREDQPIRIAQWDKARGRLAFITRGDLELKNLLDQFAAQQAATVSTPKELAQRLALITRWLYDVIVDVFGEQGAQGELHQQYAAFRKTLLPTLQPDEFADTYAQTIVYGLFAARVSLPHAQQFSRLDAAQALPKTNPFLRKLFQEIAGFDLDPRIAWLVDDCARVLAHTDMSAVLQDFGKATRQEDPVVHFYETFLQAYDPRLRETRGVYYTPEPVVGYIVRSVDAVLRTHFGKALGLADDDAIILDPATGTATFLHAVIQQIHTALQDAGLGGAWNGYVPQKLLPRVFGFELLMAPYTVAHLKLGLLLGELGYSFNSNERLGVFLTNTLDRAPTEQLSLAFAQFITDEGRAADQVKQHKDVMVVLGNPPYSGHSANKGEWIGNLVEDYKRGIPELYKPAQAKWLQDDYVKFMRFGQWRINQTGEGVLAFISNHGYLDNPTFRGMRQSLLQEFDEIYILNLHGNSKKKERAPDGGPDENVFDIQQGVAIAIFVKKPTTAAQSASTAAYNDSTAAKNASATTHSDSTPTDSDLMAPLRHTVVHYADLWGKRDSKYAALNATDVATTQWQTLIPAAPFHLFVPQDADLRKEYEQGWKITNIMDQNGDPAPGVVTTQDEFAISWSAEHAKQKIERFLRTQSEDEARSIWRLCSQNQWNYHRAKIALASNNWQDHIVPILYRPFDIRWTVFDPNVAVHRRERVMRHMLQGNNIGFVTSRQTRDDWGLLVSNTVCGHKSYAAYDINFLFPLYVYPNQDLLIDDASTGPGGRRANLNPQFVDELARRLGLRWVADGKGDVSASVHNPTTFGPEDVFHYAYAVFHSPTYRQRYAPFLKIDFPRLPWPASVEQFAALAAKGAALVDLHLLRLTGAGGVGGAGGATVLQSPGKQGVQFPAAGTNVVDKVHYDMQAERVMINNTQYFAGIDADTWAVGVGGYQPLDKWLKDRRGRTLTTDDIVHYLRMVIALRETRRVMAEIDAVMHFPTGE